MKRELELNDKVSSGKPLTNKEREELIKLLASRMPDDYPNELQTERKAKAARQGYLVDTIWPESTIHLIAGSSGIGKSTWFLQAIHDWEKGRPVMGFPSHPKPYLYLMCDRSDVDLQRTLDRIGLSDWNIKATSIERLGQPPYSINPEALTIEMLPLFFPWAEVFFIEAINWFYQGKSTNASRDYVDTLRFWSRVRDQFCEKDLTVIGTTHVPKMKANEGYTRARDKVFGSVGGPAVAGTIMVMEDEAKDPDKIIVTVCPRDAREFKVQYRRGSGGVLEYCGEMIDGEDRDRGNFLVLDKQLVKLEVGSILTSAVIKEWFIQLNLKKTTMYRWLDARLTDGQLLRLEKGRYKVKRLTVN